MPQSSTAEPQPSPFLSASAGPCALVLMGGGARTAYQAGALRELAHRLHAAQPAGARAAFPFDILLGTSAGAINAAFLASRAHQGAQALLQLARFWRRVRSSHVYDLRTPGWLRWSRIATAYLLVTQARRQGSFLDNRPLAALLQRLIDFERIGTNVQQGHLQALGVTASNYNTGEHWTFFQTAQPAAVTSGTSWWRSGRRIVEQPISAHHLLASSALPFLMPAVTLKPPAEAGAEPAAEQFFGDGSMRQVAPLSAALYQGAARVLVIGVGQPHRTGLGRHAGRAGRPSLGAIAGHAMGSVFHDTLQADVEQAQRINRALQQMPPEQAAQWPYRMVDIVALHPSQSLDALAEQHARSLPVATRQTLQGLGAFHGSGAALASYMLFEPDFVRALMALGAEDVRTQWPRLAQLLGAAAPP
ncbi:MAG: hypothetical protein GAK34_02883 [Delftia tsuruhatensis]|nr:MAG: hypothetical protein GAK34_02883 [Delftia tsuruhatensis]